MLTIRFEDRDAPGHQEEPEPSGSALRFGVDEFHHACGGEFELRCSAGFTGRDFSSDGYSYGDLDLVWDDSALVCLACGLQVDFAAWQEAAQDKTSDAWGQATPAGEETQHPTA